MKKNTEIQSFDEQLKRLDEIVEILDNTEIPLDEAIKAYEEGILLAAELRKYLDAAELKIVELGKSL